MLSAKLYFKTEILYARLYFKTEILYVNYSLSKRFNVNKCRKMKTYLKVKPSNFITCQLSLYSKST